MRFAVAGDRGQRYRAQFVIDLAGDAPVLDVVGRIEVRIDDPVVDLLGRVDLAAHRAHRSGRGRGLDVDHAAADLVDLVVVADQADGERAAVLEQRLAPHEPAVAVIGAIARAEVAQIAVALVDTRRQAHRDAVGHRTGDQRLADHRVEVAVGRFDRAAEVELRLLGDDRDHAGTGVLAEQGRLRPAQDLDPLHVGQVGDLRRGAAAVDAVDEHADRRLDAGVVRAVAEAADDEVGVGRALQRGHAQAGDEARQVLDVADLRPLDRLGGRHAHRDRHVLQRLLALGRRDDDRIARGAVGLLLVTVLIAVGLGRIDRRLREGRCRKSDAGDACEQRRANGSGETHECPLQW